MGKMIDPNKSVFTHTEEMPVFPGGEEARLKFLQKNIYIPKTQIEFQSDIYITFIIDSNGELINTCILRPFYSDKLTPIESAILCVFGKMPLWIPGKQQGVPVAVKLAMPVKIELPGY